MKLATILVVIALLFSTVGCTSRIASYLVDTADHALTLEMYRRYWWSNWTIELIVRNNPQCQRRHTLHPSNEKMPFVDLYAYNQTVYLLRQGHKWYATEVSSCSFEMLKKAPPTPGKLLGTFWEYKNIYKFFKKT